MPRLKQSAPLGKQGQAAAKPPRKRPKLNPAVFNRLMKYIFKGRGFTFAVVIICVLVASISSVLGSLFLLTLIDDYIAPLLLESNPVFSGLAQAVLKMGIIYGIGIIANFAAQYIMVLVSQRTLKVIRDDMFSHMQSLPIRYFDTHTHGDIMSHYTNDADTLRQLISQSLPQMFSSVITIIAVLAAMLMTSLWLTLIVLLGVGLMLFTGSRLASKSGKYFMQQQNSLGKINGYIEEMIHGQRVIKVFCHEQAVKEEFDIINDELKENSTQANIFANIMMPTMANIGNITFVLVAFVGGLLVVGDIGGITLGAIAAFLNLTKTFTQPVSQIAQQFNSVVMALAGAERIFKLMDEEPEKDEGYVTLVNVKQADGELRESVEKTGHWAWKHPHSDGSLEYVPLAGDVRMFDVDFGYTEDKQVLFNLSLFAKPGQKLAFVGATGAGKTTITNLLNRFYDIDDGKIRYDGININKIKKPDLRRSLGMVLQDTNLFSGTIMDNIRYGRTDASDEECIEAAKLANAHSFITRLPQGYQTEIDGKGGSLSQGQRQLLAIARCAVNDPPAMILDEATSSIDTRTEALVQRGMDKLMENRTVFVIAHRLATVRNANAILVMDFGRVIERGDHEDLIAQQGKYYQLYTGAFELE